MILVTGATGILGRVIVLELLKRGKTVRAAKRATSNTEEVRHSFQFYTEKANEFFDKINWINVDFEDLDSINQALNGVSGVYHCAAKVSFHPDSSAEMEQCNIGFTENLLYACENSSVKKFLFVSSIAVLDHANENEILGENSYFNPKETHSYYALSKHFAEMEIWRASAEGLNTIIVNPGVIIGSGNWQNSSGKIFEQLSQNKFSFSGGAAYVDVRDAAKISIDLMEKNSFGERFILISETKSYEETANFLRQQIGKSKVKILPIWLLKSGVIFNFLFGWFIKPLKMVNSVNIKSVSYQSEISNEKIKKELNIKFIPVFESLDFHFNNYLKDHPSP
jgi:dihydroflavonol-4-reductase